MARSMPASGRFCRRAGLTLWRWFSTAEARTTAAPRPHTAATAPGLLMSVQGLGITLKVKVIPPLWEVMKTGQVTNIRNGGVLLDFVPHSGGQGWIRFSLLVPECGKVLVMDPAVGLQLVHNQTTPSGGQETKTVEWTPADSDKEMELRVVHSADGTQRNFRVPFEESTLALLQTLLERSLPVITGFDCSPVNPHTGTSMANLSFFKDNVALLVGFLAPLPAAAAAAGKPGGPMSTQGRLSFRIAARGSGLRGNGPAFDWANSLSFFLGADDCAEFASMRLERDGDYMWLPINTSERQKTMIWRRAPDGNGVVAEVSGKGLSLQLPLSWAELKVLQVVAQSVIPHMLGLGWL
eukprot:EG_transcript_12861